MFKRPSGPSFINSRDIGLIHGELCLVALFTVNDETHVINFVMVLERSTYRNYSNVHQQRKRVGADIIWLLRASSLISEIRICLSFQKSSSEGSGRLVKTNHHDAIVFIKSFALDSA